MQTNHGKIDKPGEILEYAKRFYEELYSLRPMILDDRFFEKCPKLSVESASDLDKELTIEFIICYGCDGQVVSLLALNPDDPSLNPSRVCSFFK